MQTVARAGRVGADDHTLMKETSPQLDCLLNATHLLSWTARNSGRGMPPTHCLGRAGRCVDSHWGSFEGGLRTLLGLLLLLGDEILPAGSIVDAGTHLGIDACWYAALAPERKVHALDPVAANAAWLWRQISDNNRSAFGYNIRPMHAGLGDEEVHVAGVPAVGFRAGAQVSLSWNSTRHTPHVAAHNTMQHSGAASATSTPLSDTHALAALRAATAPPWLPVLAATESIKQWLEAAAVLANVTSFTAFRLDFLLSHAWSGERLGLLHLDVEGHEAGVLRGASHTLRQHRPVLTLEAHTNTSVRHYDAADETRVDEMEDALRRAGYGRHVYVVDEVCGSGGCRNLVVFPAGGAGEAFEASELRRIFDSSERLARCDPAESLWVCLQASVRRIERRMGT